MLTFVGITLMGDWTTVYQARVSVCSVPCQAFHILIRQEFSTGSGTLEGNGTAYSEMEESTGIELKAGPDRNWTRSKSWSICSVLKYESITCSLSSMDESQGLLFSTASERSRLKNLGTCLNLPFFPPFKGISTYLLLLTSSPWGLSVCQVDQLLPVRSSKGSLVS